MKTHTNPSLPSGFHRGAGTEAKKQPALLIAWSAEEPERVGEIAPLFGTRTWVLGRGSSNVHPDQARVRFVRSRPGHQLSMPSLGGAGLSRKQLTIRLQGKALLIENVGRCPLSVNGRAVTEATVNAGDMLLLGSQLLLRVTHRPTSIDPLGCNDKSACHRFGGPDAFGIVGESPAAWRLRAQCALAGASSEHVLILGESGSGKELVSRAIHGLSPCAEQPFVARNAATLPEGLVDAELFGNRAHYPHADAPERPGLIGEADGSTLFLDELAETPEHLQARLLRVLDQGGEYQRLGESRVRSANFRFVAATNRPMERIKHDLLARLSVRIRVPGLNERRDDIPLLVRHVLRRMARTSPGLQKRFSDAPGKPLRTSPELIASLSRHEFSHHVRELGALLWEAATESTGNYIEQTRELEPNKPVPDRRTSPTADEIAACLKQNDGNRELTARELGLKSRYALYRLMRRYDLVGSQTNSTA